MDPKQSGNPASIGTSQPLDPKLQEVYDKVMGVNLSGDTTPSSAPTVTPASPATLDPMITQTTGSGSTTMPTDPMTIPTPPASTSLGGSSVMPSMPQDPMAASAPSAPGTIQDTIQNPALQSPASSSAGPTVTVSVPPVDATATPTMPNPSGTGPTVSVAPAATLPEQPASAASAPAMPQDSLSATIHIPTHDNQTVKIGIGGSPVGTVVKAKGKGISPVILIFGAIAFLVVYGVFWVKFFGYSLPFMPK